MTLVETITGSNASSSINWHGKAGTVFVAGTFAAGNVRLQLSIDGVTWFDAKDEAGTVLALTANGAFSFSVGNCKVRAQAASVTSVLVSIQERSF